MDVDQLAIEARTSKHINIMLAVLHHVPHRSHCTIHGSCGHRLGQNAACKSLHHAARDYATTCWTSCPADRIHAGPVCSPKVCLELALGGVEELLQRQTLHNANHLL